MEIKDFTKGSDPKAEVSTRYMHLCKTFVQIASEASKFKEGYELIVKYANEIIVKSKEIKNKHESHENPSVPNEVIHDETIFVDSLNVTKVTILKKKQPTSLSNSRPKSFLEKAKKKSKIQSPPSQTMQHDYWEMEIFHMAFFRTLSSIISRKSISTPKRYFIS
ncbi:uncharacterized protein [Solanum tuberosum]|uniref:uncharacterized protein n=1 Tax=Solanum tuberosum TaxID=4113 RepID=UPI0003D2765D|nr:PREDICTED: uncharacterized protein LOC102590213 [Solanum tuberosum]